MKLTHTVLMESRSARDYGLTEVTVRDSQQSLLRKVKNVFFALWQGGEYMTTKQVAEFYKTSEFNIRQNYKRCKSEFDADGVIKLEGEALRDARDILSLPSRTSQASLYSPRAVLRMGFMLQGSDIAAQVRTAALNLIQGAYEVFDPKVVEALIDYQAALKPINGAGKLAVSSPLSPYYDAIERHLKRKYPHGGIPGMGREDIRKELAALSTWTANLKLETRTELRYSLAQSVCAKYPDLTSQVHQITVDGQSKTVVLMFHIGGSLVVDETDVESALAKQYIKRAKEHSQVDYAFLFLIAPFGATPRAEDYIRKELPEEMKGFIGVMTVKEVAELLLKQARNERKSNLIKGEARRDFEAILEYEIPDSPLLIII